RYPLTAGFPPPSEWNNYDRLSDPNLLGPEATGLAYVTGTGAHDIITLTDAGGGMADVTIEAFRDSAHTDPIDVPGQPAGTTVFSYTIDTTNGVLIEAGDGDDQIVIDGNLAAGITVHGMAGTDTLVVDGAGGDLAYLPSPASTTGLDGNESFGGVVTSITTG